MTLKSPRDARKITKILLLGAGELGLAFLFHISLLSNIHIVIGVRSPNHYAHLRSTNVDLIALDLTSSSFTLTKTFADYDIIISATGFTLALDSVTKLANEVLSAGKLRKDKGQGRLWYFPWQWGVDYDITLDGNGLMPLFGEQKKVRDLLRLEAKAHNVKWTVVSTGIFMSFLFEPSWGIVDRSRQREGKLVVRCLRDWEHRVTVTDVTDIGRVLARILAGDVKVDSNVLYISGDTVSYTELADVVESVAGCEVQRELWSIEHLEEELRRDLDDGIKRYRLVFAGEGVWWEIRDTVNYELEMNMLDVKTYAKKIFGVQK